MKFEEHEDSNEHKMLVESKNKLDEHSKDHSKVPLEKEDNKHDMLPVAPPSSTNVRCIFPDTMFNNGVFHVVRHHRLVRTLTW